MDVEILVVSATFAVLPRPLRWPVHERQEIAVALPRTRDSSQDLPSQWSPTEHQLGSSVQILD